MRAGALSSMTFSLGFALFDCPSAAYAMLPLLAVQLGAIPSYSNVYSSCFGPEEQASIFAAVSILQSVSSIVAPLVFNLAYSFTVKAMPTAVFYLISGTAAVAATLLFRATTTTTTSTVAKEKGGSTCNGSQQPAAEGGGLRSPLLQGGHEGGREEGAMTIC